MIPGIVAQGAAGAAGGGGPGEAPFIVQSTHFLSTDNDNFHEYYLPDEPQEGNWLLWILSANDDSPIDAPSGGWATLVAGPTGFDTRLTTSIFAIKVGEGEGAGLQTKTSGPLFFVTEGTIVEIGGINPAATDLPGHFWADNGYLFGADSSEDIVDDHTLFIGHQSLRPFTSSESPTGTGTTVLWDEAGPSSGNRKGFAVYKDDCMSGDTIAAQTNSGNSAQSAYGVAQVTNGY